MTQVGDFEARVARYLAEGNLAEILNTCDEFELTVSYNFLPFLWPNF
jgi:hypothetical protein